MTKKPLRILLVEDNPGDVALLRALVARDLDLRLELHHVGRLRDAIAVASIEPFDAALLDLSLPDSFGREAFDVLRTHSPRLPIIVLTGREDFELAESLLSAGAQDYLLKQDIGSFPIGRCIRYAISRKQAEENVRASESRLRSFVRHTPTAVAMFDRDMRCLVASDRWIADHGLTGRGIDGRRIDELLSWAPRHWQSAWREAVDGKGQVHEEEPVRIADRTEWIRWEVHPWHGGEDSVSGFVLFTELLTERKKLAEQLDRAQRLEALGQLAAGIAHEINTPMQYIGDNIRFLRETHHALLPVLEAARELLGEETPSQAALDKLRSAGAGVDLEFFSAEIPQAVEQSLEGVDRVSEIVRSMRAFAHPGQNDRASVDLNQIVATAANLARSEWRYVAELRLDLAPDLPPVTCDAGAIGQAILNLLVNAAHAIELVRSERPELGEIHLTTRRGEGYVELSVRDTGGGIPEAVRGRVFDPFFTTKEVGRGTGQGLAIVHAIVVERHGGSVTLESVEGEGTTFCIRLPIPEEEKPE